MKRITKSILALVTAIAIMQTSLPVLACSHTSSEDGISPLCGAEILVCNTNMPGEWVGQGTHTYNLGQKTCTKDFYKRPTIVMCWYCGVRGKDDGFLHDCFIDHHSCGAGKEYVCRMDGSLPSD